MVVAVFLSRVIGFARDIFIAARFGAGWETDAYNAAFQIPDLLNHFVAGGVLSITFLPIYARHLAEDDEARANRALSAVATIMVVVVALGALAGIVLARPFCEWWFEDLDPRALEATIRYTRILMPAQVFFFAGGLASATLFARGKFAAAALAPLLYNVGIIAGGVLLGGSIGVEGLAWGALAGAFVGPFLIPAIDARRKGARVTPAFTPRDPGFVEWVKLSLPLMIGVSMVTADDWFIRKLASADEGAITRLGYAKRLVMVAIAVAGQAVGQASMPFFTRLFAEGKRDELARTFARTARSACVFAMIVAAAMVALAGPMIDILFRRGKFTFADVPPTATYLAVFAAAVPLWALQGLASRIFYAARNTMTPLVVGTIVTALSVPIYWALFEVAGPTGLAIASGIAMFMHTGAILVAAPRILPELRGAIGGELGPLARGFALAAVAGGTAWLATWAIHASSLIEGLAGGAVLAVVVLALAPLLRVAEIGSILSRVARKLRR